VGDAALDLGKQRSTQAAYVLEWSRFEAFCADRGLVSLPASAEVLCRYVAVLQAGLLRRPAPGPPLPYASVEVALAAIRLQHLAAGFPAPARTGRFRRVLDGAKRASASLEVAKARPARAEDIRWLVGPVPGPSAWGLQRAVAAGTARLMPARRVAALCAADVGLAGWGVVLGGGRAEVELACACTEQPWSRWSCVACAIRVLAQRRAHGPLLRNESGDRAAGAAEVARWRGVVRDRSTRLGTDPGLPARALLDAVTLHTDLARWLQGRAIILTAWHRGLRPNDWYHLRRSDARRREADWAITLPRAKNQDDPVQLSWRAARDAALCPVQALDDWTLLVDRVAQVRGEDPAAVALFPPLRGGLPDAGRGRHLESHPTWMWHWQHSHGVVPRFSGLSMRTGFVAEALAAGFTIEQIQFVLRHRRLSTTFGYAAAELAERRAASLVLAGLPVFGGAVAA
jgi:hypothetical protein